MFSSSVVHDYHTCPRMLWFQHHDATTTGAESKEATEEPPIPAWANEVVDIEDPLLSLREHVYIARTQDGQRVVVNASHNDPPFSVEQERVRLRIQAASLRQKGIQVSALRIVNSHTQEYVDHPCDFQDMDRGLNIWGDIVTLLANANPPAPLHQAPQCAKCPYLEACVTHAVATMQQGTHAPTHPSVSTVTTPAPATHTPAKELLAPTEQTDASSKNESSSSTDTPRSVPPRQDQLPVVVHLPGSVLKIQKGELVVYGPNGSKLLRQGIQTVSNVNLYGGVHITTPALVTLMDADIPVCFFSSRGWYRGRTHGSKDMGVLGRMAQVRALDNGQSFVISQQLVADKIFNQRVFLRRHNRNGAHDHALKDMDSMLAKVEGASETESLRGFEGNAARIYWDAYAKLIASANAEFSMNGRSRRPPRDRPNAMLSYMYGMLARSCAIEIENAGLDAHVGMYHVPQTGRPSLALDLMEPFRPLIVDSAVYNLISRKWVKPEDFIMDNQDVTMQRPARTAVIRAFESRMDEVIKHPVSGLDLAYRRLLRSHADAMRRYFERETDTPPSYRTR